MTTLNMISVGEAAVVLTVDTHPSLKQRLFDVGLVPGTRVRVLHESPSGNPRAYFVRGTVIAVRNCDAENIIVRAEADE